MNAPKPISDRVWGVRCPDGPVLSVTLIESVAHEPATKWDDASCTGGPGPHRVVYADIEWEENVTDEYDDRDAEQHELLFPFTCVTSAGGPHEDHAFVAGVQLGQLIERLRPRHIAATTDLVDDTLEAQCDLMAMAYGYSSEVLARPDGWIHVGFTRQDTPTL